MNISNSLIRCIYVVFLILFIFQNYILNLKAGTYGIKFQFIGYTTQEKTVVISDRDIRLNVVLLEDEQFLKTLVIKGDRKDPAYEIMKRVLANKDKNWDPPSSFRIFAVDSYNGTSNLILRQAKKISNRMLKANNHQYLKQRLINCFIPNTDSRFSF